MPEFKVLNWGLKLAFHISKCYHSSLWAVTGKTGAGPLTCCQHGMTLLHLKGRASEFIELDAALCYQIAWPLYFKRSLIAIPKINVYSFFWKFPAGPICSTTNMVVFSRSGLLLNPCYYIQLIALC